MASKRLLIAGFGNVGRRLAEILSHQDAYPALNELDISIIGITTQSHGAMVDPDGLDPADVLRIYQKHHGFPENAKLYRRIETHQAIRELDFDILIELSSLSIATRGEPAISHVREALLRGKHVISANKGPVAWAYRELTALAREKGVTFRHEAAVMDGAPVFNLWRNCLRGNTLLAVEGVLNSTTNVVLGEMERGATMQDAVTKAQIMGIAEADPTADLEGWDAAVKLSALANVLMDADLPPERIEREGITHLTPDDVAAARARGNRIKMVCRVRRLGTAIQGGVEVCELPLDHPFAKVEGPDSVLRLRTDLMGRLIIAEDGPDLSTTAYGVIADLLALG